MTKLFIALAMTALSGCATCARHPTACAAITIVAVGSIALIAGPHDNSGTKGTDGRVTTLPVDCSMGACK